MIGEINSDVTDTNAYHKYDLPQRQPGHAEHQHPQQWRRGSYDDRNWL